MYALSLLLVCTVCISINRKTSKEACGSCSFSEAQNACLVRIELFYLLNLGRVFIKFGGDVQFLVAFPL